MQRPPRLLGSMAVASSSSPDSTPAVLQPEPELQRPDLGKPARCGLKETQSIIQEGSALLMRDTVAARQKFEAAKAALASIDIVPSPLVGEDPTFDGTTVNTWVDIPPEEEMMRQMKLTALRMLCVEA